MITNIVYIFVLLIVLLLIFYICAIFNEHLSIIWFCNKLGWHVAPKKKSFDGCSLNGICPRCGKDIMQDSQGNWF